MSIGGNVDVRVLLGRQRLRVSRTLASWLWGEALSGLSSQGVGDGGVIALSGHWHWCTGVGGGGMRQSTSSGRGEVST